MQNFKAATFDISQPKVFKITEFGSVHDKKIADQYPINLTENSTVKQDLGFVEHKPSNISIEQPFKNSENHKLTFTECIYNKMLSATRVIIEHDNSGVKRLRIIKNTTRFYSFGKRNKIMLIA